MKYFFTIILAIITVWSWPSACQAALSIVNSNLASTCTGATTTATFTSTSGNLLVVSAIRDSGGSPGATPITDSKNNTWTAAYAEVADNGSGANFERQWYAKNITGGANHTITFTVNNSAGCVTLLYLEISGADTSSPIDGTPQTYQTNSATNQTPAANMATSNANDILIGAVTNNGDATSYAAGGSYTIASNNKQEDANDFEPGAQEYRIVSATGTYGPSFTFTVAQHGALGLAAYKQAAAATPSGIAAKLGGGQLGGGKINF